MMETRGMTGRWRNGHNGTLAGREWSEGDGSLKLRESKMAGENLVPYAEKVLFYNS